ncbi:tetratricopeptide repeat protein [Sphingobacteriales bacterium UPWRP_1]|nr:hypothetical protein BVG80_07365 [Sphingobacteriales bacterium TSM_CSM]PSJ78247.1 tetratricopeptide repeat protein [Sphingobacteriales bacterium UPWRP_1]
MQKKLATLPNARKKLQQAENLHKKGRYADSNAILSQIIPGFETALAWEEEYVKALCWQGMNYTFLGQYEQGESCANTALQKAVAFFGADSLQAASAHNVLGVVYMYMGKYEKAIDNSETVINIYAANNLQNNPDVAKAHGNLGAVYMHMGEYEKAIAHLETALNSYVANKLEKHLEVAKIYLHLGGVYTHIGKHEKAIAHFKTALNCYAANNMGKHLDVAKPYINLGAVYTNMGKYEQAIAHSETAINIYVSNKLEKHVDVAMVHSNLGAVYTNMGKYEQAIYHFKTALNSYVANNLKDHPVLAKIHLNLGGVYAYTSKYEKAIAHFETALNCYAANNMENHPELANIHPNLGVIYYYKGDYSRAEEYFKTALAVLAKNNLETEKGTIYNNLGAVCLAMADYPGALAYYQMALELKKKLFGTAHIKTALTCGAFGNCLMQMQQYEEALEKLTLARTIYEAQPDTHPEICTTYNYISACLTALSNYAEVPELLSKSLQVGKKAFGKRHPYVSFNYYVQGWYHQKTGRPVKAIRYYHKSLLSNLYQYTQTNPFHNPAPQPFGVEENFWEIWHAKITLLYRQYAQSKRQVRYLFTALFTTQAASEWITHVRSALSSDGSKLILAQKASEIYAAGTGIALRAAEVAGKKNEQWQKAANEITLFNRDSYPAAQFTYCLTQQECLATAFRFSELSRAMVLLGNIRDREAKGAAAVPKHLLQQEYDLKVDLNYYRKKINEEHTKKKARQNQTDLNEWQLKLHGLQQEYDAFITRLEKDYPAYYNLKYSLDTVSIPQLQQALSTAPVQTLLLSYSITEQYIYTFAISASGFEVYEKKKPESFEDDIEDFLKFGINDRIKTTYEEYGYALYQLLLQEPITGFNFTRSGTEISQKRLIIIPHGILSRLPFEALLTREGNNQPYSQLPYLQNSVAVSYHFSATLWHEAQQQNAKSAQEPALETTFTGFAPVYAPASAASRLLTPLLTHQQPQPAVQPALQIPFKAAATRKVSIGGKTYSALLYSETEVMQIAGLYYPTEAETYVHSKATVTNLMTKAQKSRYLLIAAHADYNDQNPELTGIILSPQSGAKATAENSDDDLFFEQKYENNILYLSDAYHLQLCADLVVLSCCETGIGKLRHGEGMMSLNRGFLYSGAKNIVYTVFKVYDEQSSHLTFSLFRFIKSGSPYWQALQQAKAGQIAANMAPVFWCGFLLAGE